MVAQLAHARAPDPLHVRGCVRRRTRRGRYLPQLCVSAVASSAVAVRTFSNAASMPGAFSRRLSSVRSAVANSRFLVQSSPAPRWARGLPSRRLSRRQAGFDVVDRCFQRRYAVLGRLHLQQGLRDVFSAATSAQAAADAPLEGATADGVASGGVELVPQPARARSRATALATADADRRWRRSGIRVVTSSAHCRLQRRAVAAGGRLTVADT